MTAAALVALLTLRPYQTQCVTEIRMAFAQWWRVLLVLATGGGKTIIFAYITLCAMAKGNRVIILAHRQEIVDQISAALTAMDVVHGRIQPGFRMTSHLVQVGMVQTVARRLDVILEPALLVIDECHHCVSATYARITVAWPKARILGVTATPERLDGVGLGEAFDHMVLGPDVRKLIDAGYLAPFRYLAPSIELDLSRIRRVGGDYDAAGLERAVNQVAIIGDAVHQYSTHLAGRTAIVFCVTVRHAEHVALQFCDAGIAAASIDGSMGSDQRRDLVNKLRDSVILVLTTCEIISEGFDAPAIGGAILLRPTQSFALFRQQVGRCLRPKPDGSAAVIIDHVGNVFRHGLPDAPHEWSLDSKKPSRAKCHQTAVGCRTCKACKEVVATGTGRDMCTTPEADDCLFHPRVLMECDGQLEEIVSPPWAQGIDIRDARGWQWFQLLMLADTDPARLRQIQVARGYRQGWVRHAVRDAAAKVGAA